LSTVWLQNDDKLRRCQKWRARG